MTRFVLAVVLALLPSVAVARPKHVETGVASWYGKAYAGKPTASGEPFRLGKRTAAHRTLPFGTVVRVRRLDTGRTVRVVINDRGPFVDGRIIDLSRKAARRIHMIDDGIAKVEIKAVGCKAGYRNGCR
jgi:rare lipoprotein A